MVRPADCWGFGNRRAALSGVFDRRSCSETRVATGLDMAVEAQSVYVEPVEVQRHGMKSSMDSTAWPLAVSDHV